MGFRLEFHTYNAAFCGPDGEADEAARDTEIARILSALALQDTYSRRGSGVIRDVNGNTIGTWSLRP